MWKFNLQAELFCFPFQQFGKMLLQRRFNILRSTVAKKQNKNTSKKKKTANRKQNQLSLH